VRRFWTRIDGQLHLETLTVSQIPGNLLYYQAIEQFTTGSEYYAAAQAMTSADMDRGLAHQVWELSWTQDRKLFWLR
jgi:hypothetical protein